MAKDLTTEDTESTERATPETDADNDTQCELAAWELLREARRERDEARERAAKWESSFDTMERAGAEQACRADENREWALRAERDLAEAKELAQAFHNDQVTLLLERDEAREIAAVYKEYAQLLGDEINDMATVAYVHGWRSKRYEQGKVLLEKIKQLEAAK